MPHSGHDDLAPPAMRRPDRRTLLSAAAMTLVVAAGPPAKAEAATSAREDTLRLLSDRLIPETDTPGAVDAGCVAYVIGCIERSAPADRLRLIESLEPIGAALRTTPADAPWSALVSSVRANSAAAIRALYELRYLVLAGYYTSEVGAAKELRYDPVPGRFAPDVPVTSATRAFSSDWTGVSMGLRRG